MAYTKQTWENLPSQTTPINADRLTHIEDGIFNAAATADTAASDASSAISGLADKVDKVEGKGLSTNDFTDALKTKLDGIATGAEVNVQADYAQTDTTADDYIKNKPTLGTSAYKNSTSVVTESSDLVESGGVNDIIGWGNKNLLNPIVESSGIVTRNADNTFTVNGTLSSTTVYELGRDCLPTLPIGDYMLSGCPISGVPTGTSLSIRKSSTSTGPKNDTGNGIVWNVTDAESASAFCYILLPAGTYNNVVFKPMLEKGTVATAYEPYHASVEESLAEKADNSVIGKVENGSIASQAYAVGSHFIRNGAFCTVTTAITSGESLVGSNKFTSGNVASELETVNITNEFTFSTDCTWNTNFTGVYKSGNVIDVCLRFKTPSAVSSDKVILTFPIKYISKAQKLQYPNTFAGALFKTWSGEVGGVLTMAVSENEGRFLLASNNWLPSSEVAIRFSYLI